MELHKATSQSDLQEFHTETTKLLSRAAHEAFKLLPQLPTQVSIHQSVAHGCYFPWLPILHPCGEFRNSTAQRQDFQILLVCRTHFLHTGTCSYSFFMIVWPFRIAAVHKPSEGKLLTKLLTCQLDLPLKNKESLCLFSILSYSSSPPN